MSLSLAAHAAEISVYDGPDDTAPPLTDGQAAVIDFGCTQSGTPITRKFTVKNDSGTDLVLPANGLTLPSGFSLNPEWPRALVTPTLEITVFKDTSSSTGTPEMITLDLVTMPSIISVQDFTLRMPTDPPDGGSAPVSQWPYVDSDESLLISPTTTGLDLTPNLTTGDYLCTIPGTFSNPDGDICLEFANQVPFQGNRWREVTARFRQGALTGTLDDPLSNGEFLFGFGINNLNPPFAPSGQQNNGDAFGLSGVEVIVTLYNSETMTTETVSGVFQDVTPNDFTSTATLEFTPVLVPIPLFIAAGDSYSFCVQLDALAEGAYSGDWSMENNDADENPFNFPISGIVDDTPPTIVGLPGDVFLPATGASCEAPYTWTAPTATDNLDPAPTIAQTAGPASGSNFPVGPTVVSYTATDCAGNTTVGSFTVTVQDTTPPTLVGSLPKQIILSVPAGSGGGVVTFPPLGALDDCDPAPVVTCTPGSGDFFPVGLTVVTCIATDNSGNVSIPATLNVIVIEARPSPATPPMDIVSVRDEAATGTGGTFLTFRHAYINDLGEIFFESSLGNVASTMNSALFTDVGGTVSTVAQKGTAAPNGGTYGVFDRHAYTNAGNASFQSTTSLGVTHFVDNGGLAATSQVDQPAAGGGTFRALYTPALLPNAELFTPALLYNNVGGVTTTSDTGIWNSGAAFVREGQASPIPGATYGQVFTRVVASPSTGSSVAFTATLRGVPNSTNTAVFAGPPAAPAVVVREGDPAPDTPGIFSSFAAEAIGNSGAVVVRARLRNGGPIDNSNNEVLYTNRNGTLELVARENEIAPCLPGAAGVFDRFDEMYMLDDGSIVFTAYLRGGGVTTANDRILWISDPAGDLHPLQREGQPANNASGSTMSQILEVTATPFGHIAYRGRTVPNVGDSTTTNNVGIWIQEVGGIPGGVLVLRNSDLFTIPGEKLERVINSITIEDTNNAQRGSGGYGRILNDSGDLVVKISFSGNSNGVFVIDSTPLSP